MKKSDSIFNYLAFFIGMIWLFLFTLIFSTHQYGWMLTEVSSEAMSWCSLPLERDSLRREMYILFLVQFALMALIFMRKKNIFFTISLVLFFGYATYLFMVRDMLCVSFLR